MRSRNPEALRGEPFAGHVKRAGTAGAEESLAIARSPDAGDYLRDPVPVINLVAADFTQRTTLGPGRKS